MDRGDDPSSRSLCKKVCYSLVILLVGFMFCFIIMVLAYFTYQTVFGKMDFCTLWTDIPGRLAIFVTCYYVASLCGYFPIPDRCRLNWLPEPFILWRLESWRNLFRNLYLLFQLSHLTNRIRRPARNSPRMPFFRREHQERFYDCLPITREQSEPTQIIYPDAPIDRVVVRKTEVSRNESLEISNSSEESFMSFDSPVCGYIVPMAKGKSSKPHYVPDSSISNSESLDDPFGAMSDLVRVEIHSPGTLDDSADGSANHEARVLSQRRDGADTPARTPDVDIPLPNYPRLPWGLLKHSGGIPSSARVLHRRNLRIERREVEKHIRRQRREALKEGKEATREAELPTEKRAESGWITDSDEVDSLANRPFQLPPLPPRRRFRSRGRFRTTPGKLGKPSQCRVQTHRRAGSDLSQQTQSVASPQSPPKSEEHSEEIETKDESAKCCEHSPNIQLKLDRITSMLTRFGQAPQTDTGASRILEYRQNIDIAERETIETVNRNVDSPEISASSTRTKLTEKPDVKISFTPPKDKSEDDSSGSSSTDA